MATVTHDERSFLVDGERVWLVSGSIHYFRVPRELWRDRLLKAKRAGLNCISTYVAWNVHEPAENDWHLTGQEDVVEFVRQAGELGLYVILRPGPYICAEWDFGGLPGWLTAKPAMACRTSNAAFTHYFDKYFRQVLPRLSELQVSRGGNIILIQNENEYVMTTMPDRLSYLEFINQLFRRSGFDIPIINCNLFSDPPVPDNVECVNTGDREVELLKQMRLRQPNAPLLVTELYTGWFDCWADKHQTRDARDVARHAMQALGSGGQFNYYVWHGGTNFGFGGGRSPRCHDAYVTTSYDYDAPLAEGGGLTRKYYLTRLVNLLANHMGKYLASCAMEEPGVNVHNGTDVLNMYGPLGRWAIVTNNGKYDVSTATVSLPEGPRLEVPLEPFGAAAIPVDLQLTQTHHLDHVNLTPLGMFGGRILLLHGPAGFEAVLSVNQREVRCQVPAGDEPVLIDNQGLLVVVVNSSLAERTWPLEDSILFGPAFVGETADDVVHCPGAKQVTTLNLEDGKLTHKKVKPPGERKPACPRLSHWTRRRVCTEPVADDLAWTKLDRPADVARLGVQQGYVWYRVTIDCERAKKRHLVLPHCEDRATVYLNGELVGVWGRGDGATRAALPASFKRGPNELVVLADNLGRLDGGPKIGELKGLYGHVFDASPLKARQFKVKPAEGVSRRLIPRQYSHLAPKLDEMPVDSAELSVPLTRVVPLYISFANLPREAALLCNGRLVEFFSLHGSNWGDVVLTAELKKGRNVLELLLWGGADAKALNNISVYALDENLTQKAQWSWRKWQLPEGEGPVVGKDRPAWYTATFKYAPTKTPLFLTVLSAKKGQIFLNGRNLGRFWNVGPQQRYYLPECWLAEQNELLIFEEQGNIPADSRLEFVPLGPYGD